MFSEQYKFIIIVIIENLIPIRLGLSGSHLEVLVVGTSHTT